MIHYKIYRNTRELPKAWDALPVNDIFLKSDFLEGLENSLPTNISGYYIGIFKSEILVGIAIVQRVQMYADDIFRKSSNNTLKQFGKQLVSKIVKGNALVVGNLMHTGQHGIYFNQNDISQNDYLNQLEKVLDDLISEIKAKFNKKVRIIVFKDYFEDDNIHESKAFFKANNLYKVQVQPNMIFSIPETWKKTEDYISAFNKKYRRRYKTARKKSTHLNYKELNTEYIKNNSKTIFSLYETVSDNARVNSFKLEENHFYQLKVHLKDNFKVIGVFLKEELVGFYTLILNDKTLETYFLGYNKALQHEYQMYLNMLFNMASFGIENGFKSIVYARTAMEIKSSIGAKPQTMHIYLNHTNNFIANTVLKWIVKYMNPMRKWEERHPFK
ncbi:MAG: GNAT family N-acetyltransferase [Algibacter sp.]|uniref:GNAT family N-acetyltransferase n=1 Tax=Algibacter sp. TaxID=1872428 RepID=UPI002634CB9A|nr:GNAT family N-acetyltransferase [Algibacter sp.]MDG1730495.1 GNAT family N-acetyltransferase [Algibacter sp.]MDG2179717.1 GNAT family N-acetyltransferase [Algibacter sp.]